MAWRAAASLTTFHDQLKAAYPRAVPPATPASSWGTVGDLAHQAGSSDHNPKDFPGWGDDIVTAADTPHAPALGLNFGEVAEALRLSRDPRIKYVIFNRRQFSAYPSGGYAAWTWRPYSGSNPHTTHGHLSVVGDARADSTAPWQIGVSTMTSPVQEQAAQSWLGEGRPWTSTTLQEVWKLADTFADAAEADEARDLRGEGKLDELKGLIQTLASGGATAEMLQAAAVQARAAEATAFLRSLGAEVTWPAGPTT